MPRRRVPIASPCSAAVLMVLLISACESSQQPPVVTPTSGSVRQFEIGEGSTDWPYWPVSMRIHPLTRIMDNDNGLIIEVRVEFSDAHGSTTRSVGQLRLMLIETVGEAQGQLLEEWNKDLRELDINVLHFDDITRTYLFRLELDPALFSRTAELRAHFLAADNSRLNASHRFR